MAESVDTNDKEATRKAEKLKRHRNRNLSFDLNRSSPQVKEKYKRDNQSERMPAISPQIEDRSATINAPRASQGAVPKQRPPRGDLQQEEEIPWAVRNMVTESVGAMKANLDRTIEVIISDKLNKEVDKINNNIAQLAELVRKLTIAGQTNQPPTEMGYRSDQRQQPSRQHYLLDEPLNMTARNETWRIRVDKLGIEFNGSQGGRDQLSVEDFVFRLEHMQRQYQIPWDEILRDFHLLVSGPVKQWYWALLQTTRISDWNTLRMALLNRYKAVRSNWELMHDLVERKQLPGESIDEFFHNLNILRARLEVPVAEGEMIRIAKKNLKDSLSRIVYPMSVSSVEHLRMECLQAERTFAKREYRNIPPAVRPMRAVNEATVVESDDEEEVYNEVAAIDNEPGCWNCQQKGHYFKECTSLKRSLFCYKCGKPNTTTPNCQKCQAKGNTRRGAVSTGESRPSGNAPKSN